MCDVADGPTVSDERWRKARIEHRCFACGEGIRPGDLYHVLSGKWDGRWERYKHCARCWSMFALLAAETCEPVDLSLDCGEVWENPPDDVAALAFMTPDEAQDRLREHDLR